jgi:hypothetical protein
MDFNALARRFKSIVDRKEPAKTLVRPPQPVARPSEAEILHAQLHDWARSAPEEFDGHLHSVLEAAHDLADRGRQAHAELSYWTGYERAIRDVRLAFTKWTEPYAGNSAEPTLQGGLDGQ